MAYIGRGKIPVFLEIIWAEYWNRLRSTAEKRIGLWRMTRALAEGSDWALI